MLRRHLMTHYGQTPDDYRAKWGLPADYPMVAPDYAERRRVLAKEIGLGTKGRGGGRKPARTAAKPAAKRDRKSGGEGKSVSVRVALGGGRINKKTKKLKPPIKH